MKKEILKTAFLCAASAAVGAAAAYTAAQYIAKTDEIKIIDEARAVIAEKGDPSFDYAAAREGIINGYLENGGDKYTYYTDESESETERDEEMTKYLNVSPTCKGSGIEVEKSKAGNIALVTVKKDGAADAQGLREGDEIIALDGVSILEQGYAYYANKFLGKPDTVIKLTVLRNGETFDIDFKRVNVNVGEVTGRKIGKTGYVRISYFDDFTVGLVDELLESFSDVDSLILDLRDCPGGLTAVCVKISGRFIDEGSVKLERFKGETTKYEVEKSGTFTNVPIAVLVNGNTASAAEIFTALIKDNAEGCILVGETTFGKGIFQQEEKLKSGGKLHYTAGEFYVDNRENWQGVGISPDVEVQMDPALIGTDDDIQLKKAMELLD